MQSDRVSHAVAKGNAYRILHDSIRRAGLPCQAFVDGVSIKIDAWSKFEPDASVSCATTDPDSVLISERSVVHHQRDGDRIATRIIGETGEVIFDPPGFRIVFADIFADLPQTIAATGALGG